MKVPGDLKVCSVLVSVTINLSGYEYVSKRYIY